jgi:putative ABC transport system ATP-binding protein
VLLADEPTAQLDHIQVEGVIQLIRRLAQPGRTVLVATHDDRMIPFADRVVELAPRVSEDTGAPDQVTLAAGEVLFEQGSRGGRVYFVESGRMEIVRVHADGSEEHLIYVAPPAYFGEMGPMLGLPRSATARAAEDTVLTSYSIRDFRHRAGTEERARLGDNGS